MPAAPAASSRAGPGSAGPGAIHGRIVRPEGLDPRSGSGGDQPTDVGVSGDTVVARDGAGQVAGSATSASDGSFTIRLPAGMYRVVEGICGVGRSVEIPAAGMVELMISVPNAC
jgi:hypothetical protein